MLLATGPASPDEPDVPTFVEVGSDDRGRLSGPAMRTFRSIADAWALSERDRLVLLGQPGRSTYHQWMRKAREHEPLTLPFDTLMRISALIGIESALSLLFEEHAQALTWMHGAHRGTAFAGASPMETLLEGTQDGMMTVRRYLDAWRGGQMGHGAPEGSFEPVTAEDLVFV